MSNGEVIFLIPYFGSIPQNYCIWEQTASKNSNYCFCFITDLEIQITAQNVRRIKMSFSELQQLIKQKIPNAHKCNEPYKLCDYKPALGYLFEDTIRQYKYWGWIDVDLILGNLDSFIIKYLRNGVDKINYQGHFSIFKNNNKMNRLFLASYPHVLDYSYAYNTRYICHFDENGTVAQIPRSDSSFQFVQIPDYYDVPVYHYKMIEPSSGREVIVLWNEGHLYMCNESINREIMYAHFQKRGMTGSISKGSKSFVAWRTSYINNITKEDAIELMKKQEDEKEIEYRDSIQKIILRMRIKNIRNGALKKRFYCWLKRIK